ncbi:RNA ligase family protein [Micromonospora chalcea]|uniref:RNA ligase family protein n=1 Tax=Micromonospora chalcea TaxID=1874 RepID=UPI003D7641F0
MTILTTSEVDLAALDSATKYPSIPTYHTLQPNGALLDEHIPFTGQVVVTEKVDGTNGRIVVMPDGRYVIGSRKELLTASGDLVANPVHGIVDTLRPIAEKVGSWVSDEESILVLYLEVYGGTQLPAARDYTGDGALGARLFDMVRIPDPAQVLSLPVEQIASWREHGGQRFFAEGALGAEALALGVELCPRLGVVAAEELPDTVDEAHAWMEQLLPRTQAALDPNAKGRPEGLVLRSLDRSTIAKLRFQSYRRTAQVRAGNR